MGLFNKNKKSKPKEINKSQMQLPKLPKLPDLPGMEEDSLKNSMPLNKLPSIPSNSYGNKFSQDSIKEAVSGGKEAEDDVDDLDMDQVIQHPPRKSMVDELDEEIEEEDLEMPARRNHLHQSRKATIEEGPIFVRIDRFEDALRVFEETRDKVSEIEDLLAEIKKTKEKEEKELISWENNLKNLKKNIERADRDIFSKV